MRTSPLLLLAVSVACSCLVITPSLAENPCCSFPCQNQGVCLTGKQSGTYTCDCTNLEFDGTNCQIPYFFQRIKMAIRPSSGTLHTLLVRPRFKWIWDFINSVQWLHDFFMKKIYLMRADILDTPPVYETLHGYTTVTAHTNGSLYARTLPPVPTDCPTPMGVVGKKELPDVDQLIKKFFTRKTFRPDPMGSSVLFTFFAQHFSHMFFKTDLNKGVGWTWSGHGVDVTNIYGATVGDENLLRSFTDGKLKMQFLNGETFPMYVKDVPIKMNYLPGMQETSKFALGHSFFGLMPGLMLYETIWMREHNRICDIMKVEHPDWDDERLFQTVKLIVLGETIKIVIEDYVQHLANYNIRIRFRPTVLFGEPFQYQNKINVEFNHLYHWHPLMPDNFNINGTEVTMKDFIFHSELVVKYGTAVMTDSLSRQRAGQMSHHNHGATTLNVLRDTILHGRELKFQSFNNYRRRFNLAPYNSFEEMTGDRELAVELKEFYEDIDAVEFYVGILMEKRQKNNIFGETVVEIGGPFSVKGLMANPICSPKYWRPSTFGGQVGFDIIQTINLEKLFCKNINGPCPLVSFRVPDYKEGDVDDQNNHRQQKREEL